MTSCNDNINKKIDLAYDILRYIMLSTDVEEQDIGMYVVTLAAFIDSYGSAFADTIINSYIDANITRKEEVIKNGENDKDPKAVAGLCSTHFKLYIGKNRILKTKKSTNINLLKGSSKLEELEKFIHEMHHTIKGYNNPIIYENDFTKVRLRTGILEKNFVLSYEKDIKNEYTEEGINQLQTENLMYRIITYCNLDIKNDFARRYLNTLKEELIDYKPPITYIGVKDILKNVYYDRKFRCEYDKDSIIGNIDDIYDNFDYYAGDGSFNELSKSIDDYYNSKLSDEDSMTKAVQLVVKYKYSNRK